MRKIDHYAPVTDRVTGDIVATAADRDRQPHLARESDRLDNVGNPLALNDEERPTVDHGIPHGPRTVIARARGSEGIAAQAAAKGFNGSAKGCRVPVVNCLAIHCGTSPSIEKAYGHSPTLGSG